MVGWMLGRGAQAPIQPAITAAVQAFMRSPGAQRDLRDQDGFCLACEEWTGHAHDCSFVALRKAVADKSDRTTGA